MKEVSDQQTRTVQLHDTDTKPLIELKERTQSYQPCSTKT